MLNELINKTAIVTGASKGIGRAIAIELAKNDIEIILIGRNEDDLKNTKEYINKNNGISTYYVTDISNSKVYLETLTTILNKYKSIDILVNNAGINIDKIILRMDELSWDKVINTNLKGTFLAIHKVSKSMVKNKWGRIINITSISGLTGTIGQSNYSASKAGIVGLSKSIAKELASRNITVNCISPGFIETNMTQKLNENIKKKYLDLIPLNRFGKPIEVAKLVCFICSDEADYITGQTINIDGGMLM